MKEIKVGDWVNSYSKGVYRIENIIDNFYEEYSPDLDGNSIGDKTKHSTVVSKRVLNSKFKKSIGYESCSEYFVSHLDERQLTELRKILTANPELLTELNEYSIPTIITVYNLPLNIANELDLHIVSELMHFVRRGKTFIDVENKMKELDILRLRPKYFGNYVLQLLNFDEEYVDKRKVWRGAELTKH